MRKVSLVFLFITFFFTPLLWALKPGSGYVPDEPTALKVAEAILIAYEGEKKFNEQKPYDVFLKDGIWNVSGAGDCAQKPGCRGGGGVEMKISKEDGRILELHYAR